VNVTDLSHWAFGYAISLAAHFLLEPNPHSWYRPHDHLSIQYPSILLSISTLLRVTLAETRKRQVGDLSDLLQAILGRLHSSLPFHCGLAARNSIARFAELCISVEFRVEQERFWDVAESHLSRGEMMVISFSERDRRDMSPLQ
jgi:hypothetical protein